jgi:RNA polymerase sigma factor (sigma-70 family)
MDSLEFGNRLSQIRTHWSVLLGAQSAQAPAEIPHRALVEHYLGAAYHYLLGAVRDPDLAEELCQEFALRFLRGDFRRVRPGRGRFRDYLRVVLINLVNDARRQARNAPRQGDQWDAWSTPIDVEESEAAEFAASWREELIRCSWEALRMANPTFYAVLRLRIEEPELPSPAMAQRLSVQLGRELTAVNVRKALERAHFKFAECLLEEVRRSLGSDDLEAVEAELEELDLLRFCRSAWERWRANQVPKRTIGESNP